MSHSASVFSIGVSISVSAIRDLFSYLDFSVYAQAILDSASGNQASLLSLHDAAP
jgi:hypothetical protein